MDGVNLKPGWMSGGNDGRQRGSNFGAQSALNDMYQGDLLGGFSGNSVAVETPSVNAFQGTRTTPSSQPQPPRPERRNESYASRSSTNHSTSHTSHTNGSSTTTSSSSSSYPSSSSSYPSVGSRALGTSSANMVARPAVAARQASVAASQSRAGLVGATAGGSGLLSRTGAPAVPTPVSSTGAGSAGGWGKSAAPQPPAPTPPSATAAPALKLPPAFSLQYINKPAPSGQVAPPRVPGVTPMRATPSTPATPSASKASAPMALPLSRASAAAAAAAQQQRSAAATGGAADELAERRKAKLEQRRRFLEGLSKGEPGASDGDAGGGGGEAAAPAAEEERALPGVPAAVAVVAPLLEGKEAEEANAKEQWDAKWRAMYGSFAVEGDEESDEGGDEGSLLTEEELAAFRASYGQGTPKANPKVLLNGWSLALAPSGSNNSRLRSLADEDSDATDSD